MNKKLLTLLLILGGFMIFSLNGFKQHTEQEQQHQLEVSIVKLIVSDYEDIETIEFQGWGHSIETGMWGTTVIVNGSHRMSFSFSDIKGLDNIRGIRYNLDSFTLMEKPETKSKLRIMDRVDEIMTASINGTTVTHSNHKDEE